MRNMKEINIKNWAYYFFSYMINIKNFDSNLPKIDKTSYKSTDIYYIGYITIKNIGDYESIHRVNLCIWLLVSQIDTLKKVMKINT